MSSELAKRVGFAVVAAPAALALVWIGGLPLALLLAAVAAIGAWELFRIARAGGVDPLDALGVPLAAAIPLYAHLRLTGALTLPVAAVAALVPLVLGVAIWTRGVGGKPLAAVAVTLFGALYTGGALAFGYTLRYHDYAVGAAAGTALVGLPLILTWASDIGAYFVGRAMGKRKLIPSVSPGKTVAGAVGALFVTAVASLVYVRFVLAPVAQLALHPVWALAFGLLVSVAAQVGDLAESLLKREAGVKDSSRLLPGHGGILDRFDSLFFVLPLAQLLLGALLIPAVR